MVLLHTADWHVGQLFHEYDRTYEHQQFLNWLLEGTLVSEQIDILLIFGDVFDHQYNFGNNLRKFLETYLFYKYPSHKLSNDERLKKMFQGDNVSLNLVNRFINEYSHIDEQFERGMNPIDIDEIGTISGIVITKVKESDPNQYDALVESIR